MLLLGIQHATLRIVAEYLNVRNFRLQKMPRARPISRVLIAEFNFANQQGLFISRESIFAELDFLQTKFTGITS